MRKGRESFRAERRDTANQRENERERNRKREKERNESQRSQELFEEVTPLFSQRALERGVKGY